jgi:hypothetical protein
MDYPDVGSTPSTDELSPLDVLVSKYEELLHEVCSTDKGKTAQIYQLLVARDGVAAAGCAGSPISFSVADRICRLDTELKSVLDRIALEGSPNLEELRRAVQPPERNWWWYTKRTPNPLWTVAAVLLLTLSITMITDFTRRVLSADPEGVGILSIAIQAALAVAASSTFSESGRRFLERVFWRHMPARFLAQSKFGTALILAFIVAIAWRWGPNWLGLYYNNKAFCDAFQPECLAKRAEAQRLFRRAIALNPAEPVWHFNVGVLYESSYEYDKATAEYQEAISLSPSYARAYANLARLFVLSNQPLAGLRAAVDGMQNAPHADQAIPTLEKDLAWAEDQLGFYNDAKKHVMGALQSSDRDLRPSAYCVLAKVYTHWRKEAEARHAWEMFTSSVSDPSIHPPMIEPDCTRLAEAESHEAK